MVDLSGTEAVEKMVDDVVAKYGRIDILVNDAGIQVRKWATEFPIEDFDRVLSVNLRAYFIASRTAARYMQKQAVAASSAFPPAIPNAIPASAAPITSPRPQSTALLRPWVWSGPDSISGSMASHLVMS